MKIAQQLKEKNIAEYLIYMWQIEDLIRANDCDVDRIEENIVSRYQVSDEEHRELTRMVCQSGFDDAGRGSS